MKTKGIFWHVHHDTLLEWSDNIQERIDYIKKEKPKHEIETRLKLLKPVKGRLPAEFVKAEKSYDKSRKAYHKAREAYNKAYEAYDKAREAYDKAFEKHKKEIEELHKKECGCKEWNGEKLVFGK